MVTITPTGVFIMPTQKFAKPPKNKVPYYKKLVKHEREQSHGLEQDVKKLQRVILSLAEDFKDQGYIQGITIEEAIEVVDLTFRNGDKKMLQRIKKLTGREVAGESRVMTCPECSTSIPLLGGPTAVQCPGCMEIISRD